MVENATGTNDTARVMSGVYMANSARAEIDNGMPVDVGALVGGERELHTLTAATANTKVLGIVTTPEVDRLATTRNGYLRNFYNKADGSTGNVRVHIPRSTNVFAFSEEVLDGTPTAGSGIALGGANGKWKVVAANGEGIVATLLDTHEVDGVTLYAYQFGTDVVNQ
jgi:hypothetical protein